MMTRIVPDDDWESSSSSSDDSGTVSRSQDAGREEPEVDVCSIDDDQSATSVFANLILEQSSPAPESVDGEKYISRAQLHVAQMSIKCVSRKRLEQLKKSFTIDRGPWTRRERATLKKNWKRIKKFYPNFADPKFAFGSGHFSDSSMNRYDIKNLRRRYKDFQIMLRMAYKLDDRLICDIYSRCRKMFYDKSFRFNQRKQIPSKMEKSIIRDLKRNECLTAISNKYDVSPSVVGMIKRRPKRKRRKTFKWSKESEQFMKRLIEGMYDVDDCNQLLARDINWKRVAKKLKTFGYSVNKEQCYNKWIRIMPGAIVKRYPTT